MKIINAKVYTIEEITQEDLNNLALERNTLVQENEELKSQLRGTTHCFDEEEHKKLKEEITNLSKDVDMWNSKYNDMFDENLELKKQLRDKTEDYRRMKDNFDSKVDVLTKIATQQKEFIKFLEDEIKLYENDIQNFSKDYKAYFLLINDLKVSKSKIEEILNKYKEIVNGSKRN